MNIHCTRCGRSFREGEKIQFTGITEYHDFGQDDYKQFIYAIDRPYACTNVRHLNCRGDD